ncbi:hypothetical protein ACFV4Q_35625 [Streptomyces nojiriensis]
MPADPVTGEIRNHRRLGLLAVNKQHGALTPAFCEEIKTCRSGHEL